MRERGASGVGLGLAIARRILAAIGGRLQVERRTVTGAQGHDKRLDRLREVEVEEVLVRHRVEHARRQEVEVAAGRVPGRCEVTELRRRHRVHRATAGRGDPDRPRGQRLRAAVGDPLAVRRPGRIRQPAGRARVEHLCPPGRDVDDPQLMAMVDDGDPRVARRRRVQLVHVTDVGSGVEPSYAVRRSSTR